MANHLPVIVSGDEGLTEFVEEGKYGYIFAMESIRDLVRVLIRIIDEPKSARCFSLSTNYHRSI
jgi:glycosyltransferase involved in cell wall biosynthesis